MLVYYNVLTTGKYHFDRCYPICLATWGNNCEGRLAFATDTEVWEDERFVVVYNSSLYGMVLIKLAQSMSLLSTQIKNADWFVFVDDDTYVFTKTLEKFLETADVTCLHGFIWPRGCSSEFKQLTWPSGGAGFCVHRDVLAKLVAEMHKEPNPLVYLKHKFSDIFVGHLCQKCQIDMQHDPRFHSDRPEKYKIVPNVNDRQRDWHLSRQGENVYNPITAHTAAQCFTFHYVDAELAQTLYQAEKANG